MRIVSKIKQEKPQCDCRSNLEEINKKLKSLEEKYMGQKNLLNKGQREKRNYEIEINKLKKEINALKKRKYVKEYIEVD